MQAMDSRTEEAKYLCTAIGRRFTRAPHAGGKTHHFANTVVIHQGRDHIAVNHTYDLRATHKTSHNPCHHSL